MKKLSLLILCVAVAAASYAQRDEYKKFKGGIHLGYAVPSDGGGGVAFAIEPGYRINDQISAQLRIESALTVREFDDGTSAKVAATGSYTLNGQYYFSDEKFRPFAGLGLGWFVPASIEVDSDAATATAAYDPDGTFGFYPRVGFDYGHFNLIIDYNLIPKSEIESTISVNGVTQTSSTEFANSYISIKIGATIGGGNN